MDGDQEQMQFLGFFGIFKESFKIINSWKKIFSQITLLFIFPLTITFLAHHEVSNLLFGMTDKSEYFAGGYSDRDILAAKIQFWLFKAAYFAFLAIFSLLSTAAVVYTIACIYTAQVVTFKKVLKVVPKVWKRLIVTFLCMFLAFFLYNAITGLLAKIWEATVGNSTFGLVMFIILISVYIVGFIYMTTIWQLASVVTVLEPLYGLKAVMKAKDLVKGKKWVAMGIFFTLSCFFFGLLVVFLIFVMDDYVRMFVRIVVGLGCLFLLLGIFLFGLVIQTVLYLVCKSYHCETIDKLKLLDQLDGYLGECETAFKATKDVQLRQSQGVHFGQSHGVHVAQSQV